MSPVQRRRIGTVVLTVLYPVFALLVHRIPNPVVPGAVVALNMVFPVLAGFFFGPCSGALAGGLGAGLAALVQGSLFDGLAVLPHALMGGLAGRLGSRGSEMKASLSLLLGHVLNLLFFVRLGLLPGAVAVRPDTGLGLLTECLVEMMAVVLLGMALRKSLFCDERW